MSDNNFSKFDFGNNAGTLSFANVEQFSEWVREEKRKWDWAPDSIRPNWEMIDAEIRKCKPLGNPKAVQQLISHAATVYTSRRLLQSGSPKGVFVLDLQKSFGSDVAEAAAKFFMGDKNHQRITSAVVEGVLRALLFEKGIENNIDAERVALSTLRNEWQTEYTKLAEEVSFLKQKSESLKTEIENTQSDQAQSFKEFIDDATKTRAALEKSYREDMAVKAPVEYWKQKNIRHWISAGFWLVSLGLCSWKILLLLKQEFTYLFEKEGMDHPDYWRLAVFVLSASLGIWLIRILVRLFLSNLHLASDASERVTMVKTFLSLMSEGKIVHEEDRRLVLQALFRQAQTGLLRDEASPPTMIDVSTRLLNKEK